MRVKIQEEAVDRIEKYNGHCLLNLAPRVGKTKIAIDYLKKHPEYKKILWVAPSVEIRDSDVPAEFAKWKSKSILRRVKLIHWASLNNEDCSEYDFIILDEYHLITTNNSRTLTGKILGLSGTHPVEKEKLDILQKLKLKICYTLSIDDAVKFGIIAPYEINIITYDLDDYNKNVTAGSKNNPFLTTEFAQYTYLTNRINKLVFSGYPVPAFLYMQRQRVLHTYESRVNLAKEILSRLEGRTLIFTYQISQAEELCKHTYHSKTTDDNYKKFQNEEIDRLSLVNMASVGTTFHNMDNCIIVGTNSKAKNFEQKFCRILIPRSDYKAKIFIICANDTQDNKWVETAISNLSEENINYLNYQDVVSKKRL